MAKRTNESTPSGPDPASKGLRASEFTGGLDDRKIDQRFEGPTGRLLATIPSQNTNSMATALTSLRNKSSLRHVCRTGDFANGNAMDMSQAEDADVIVFEEFGVAILNSDPDQRSVVASTARESGMVVEPEVWNHAMGMISNRSQDQSVQPKIEQAGPSSGVEYLRGFRDALTMALESLAPPAKRDVEDVTAADFVDSASATWGLQATGVVGSLRSGAGIKVAILDSGFDISHPDFVGRSITSESFIPPTTEDRFGQIITLTDRLATIDKSGHGTHCIGTACGSLSPGIGPRYGVAHGAEVFNGKVLTVMPGASRASGADAWILAGIHWAINNGCTIISLSLGAEVEQNAPFPIAYESVASQAMANGILIVAAAGNGSDRAGLPPRIRPVARPANCPSILAVAAVSRFQNAAGRFNIANFSNRHITDQGGEVNLCGPGVDVLSSYPMPQRRQFLDGTSQATPHVAGIAALVQEETGKTGRDLYLELRSRAIVQRPAPDVDYGNGLVHV